MQSPNQFSIGDLRERVTLRRKTEATNEYGTITLTDGTIDTVWADVRPMTGGERDRAQQTEARSNYVIILRRRADLTTKDYVVWRDVQMNIRFIRDRGPRAQFMLLEVERGAP